MVKKQTLRKKSSKVSHNKASRPTRRRPKVVSALSASDSTFFLKLVMFVVLGSFWLKFAIPLALGPFMLTGIPLGLFLGIFLASRDRFQIDRKIEYTILVIVTVISYYFPSGIVI